MLVKRRGLVSLLLLVLLIACAPANAAAPPVEIPAIPSTSPQAFPSPLPDVPFSLPSAALLTPTSMPRPAVGRVLIVSFDGLRPDAIDVAPLENVLRLMQQGAYQLNAQTVLPSSTLPAHASMLSGMCPARHGVYWNEYVPENGYALGTDLFELAHQAGLHTAMIVGKQKLRQVTELENTQVFHVRQSDAAIGALAVTQIQKGFDVLFIHFYEADLAGHEWGWLSTPQLAAFRRADQALGVILRALEESGQRSSTLILVTADHGGVGHSHGGDAPGETTIPWIVVGPGIRPGRLTSPVHIVDTAATVAYALGLPLPPEWDGQPIYEVFDQPPIPRLIADPCRQTR